MDTDDLLEQLGQIERDSRLAPEWDEVLDGDRSAADVPRRDDDDDDEHQALARASAPLSAQQRRAWVQRLGAGLRAVDEDDPGHANPTAAPSLHDEDDQDHAPAEPPVDLAARRARGRRPVIVAAAAVVTMLAAMLVLWQRADPRTPQPLGPTIEALPAFHMTVRNDLAGTMRGDSDGASGPDHYRPESTIRWMVNPAQPVGQRLDLGVLVEGPGVQCLVRPNAREVSPDGVFELTGSVEDLGLTPGRWRLSIVVAVEGWLPVGEPPTCVDSSEQWCVCPAVIEPQPRGSTPTTPPVGPALAFTEPYEMVVDPG